MSERLPLVTWWTSVVVLAPSFDDTSVRAPVSYVWMSLVLAASVEIHWRELALSRDVTSLMLNIRLAFTVLRS